MSGMLFLCNNGVRFWYPWEVPPGKYCRMVTLEKKWLSVEDINTVPMNVVTFKRETSIAGPLYVQIGTEDPTAVIKDIEALIWEEKKKEIKRVKSNQPNTPRQHPESPELGNN